MNIQNLIFSSCHLKVLKFLCEYMGKDFYDAEISRMIPNISKASTNNALRDLAEWNITKRYFIGNIALNRIEADTLFAREFKKFIFVAELSDFVEEVRPWVEKMIIFGNYIEKPFSAGKVGDILIVSTKVERVGRLFRQYHYSKMLNPMLYTPSQFEWFKNESPSIWGEVQKGLILIT